MLQLFTKFQVWRASDEGATAVEYGLMVALIAVAIIVAVGVVGTNLDALFDKVGGKLVTP
jgi:pilus assembly protein Flp/PilA